MMFHLNNNYNSMKNLESLSIQDAPRADGYLWFRCCTQWTVLDVESATRMLWQMIVTSPKLVTGAEKRDGLIKMVS